MTQQPWRDTMFKPVSISPIKLERLLSIYLRVPALEIIYTGLFFQTSVELVDCWWDLQTGLEDSLLPLQTDIFGPFHKSAKITLRLNVLSDFKVTRSGNEERVLNSLNFGFLNCQRGGCHLLSLLLGLKII